MAKMAISSEFTETDRGTCGNWPNRSDMRLHTNSFTTVTETDGGSEKESALFMSAVLRVKLTLINIIVHNGRYAKRCSSNLC